MPNTNKGITEVANVLDTFRHMADVPPYGIFLNNGQCRNIADSIEYAIKKCVNRAVNKFRVSHVRIADEVNPSEIMNCKICGSEAGVYHNSHYAIFCTNVNCDRSLFGSYNPYWRINITKVVLDWNVSGWDKLEISDNDQEGLNDGK